MDDLLSEEEQIDQIRSWWSEYGAYMIGGIVIGGALLGGINYYQSNKLQAQIAASASYEALAELVIAGNLDAAEAAADAIASSYAGTTYVAQSRLAMARLYMDKNRDQDAACISGSSPAGRRPNHCRRAAPPRQRQCPGHIGGIRSADLSASAAGRAA